MHKHVNIVQKLLKYKSSLQDLPAELLRDKGIRHNYWLHTL